MDVWLIRQYDLLSPLVALYRHGQIQEHDPIYLPPISYAQLPECLRPQGDLEKRRNAWQLGAVVANALLGLPILHAGSLGKGKGKESRKLEKRRTGVAVLASYLVGQGLLQMICAKINVARNDKIGARDLLSPGRTTRSMRS